LRRKLEEKGEIYADNYIREELEKVRKEAEQAKEKIKELKKTVSFFNSKILFY